MRLPVFAWQFSLAAATFGCGDGVGHPILEPERQGAVVTATGGTSAVMNTGGTVASAGAPSVAGSGGNGGTAFSPGDFGPPRTGGGWEGREPREPTEIGAVPEGAYCESVADWNPDDDATEQILVEYLNFARESGLGCESTTPTATAGPLEVSPELRCAARLHSLDMSERSFFDHVNPDGVGPEERMRRAGATFRVASESIAIDEGQEEPGGPDDRDRWRALSGLLMARGADCKNVLDPSFDRVGVGLFDGLLTLDFTGP